MQNSLREWAGPISQLSPIGKSYDNKRLACPKKGQAFVKSAENCDQIGRKIIYYCKCERIVV